MLSTDKIAPGSSELTAEYDIVRELGSGGSAVVYLARERATGRDVAIKVIRGGYSAEREALARLSREARTVSRLEHPNIVRIYEVKQLADGGFALVMQYVPGRTLRDAIRRSGAAPLARAQRVLRDVAQALAHAHTIGIVHRDVKPENIFLDDTSGRALLSDFGIARSVEGDSDLTLTGVAIGTPTYMSPEQIDGARVDGRSDIYSLGIVGWEMLAGKRPWAGENLYSVIYRQKHEPLPRIADVRPGVPENLQYAIDGALLKDRDVRLESAEAFLAQLDSLPDAAHARERLAEAIAAERAAHPVLPPEATETVRFRRPVTLDFGAAEPEPPARRRVAPIAAGILIAALAAAAAIGLSRDEAPAKPDATVARAEQPSATGSAAGEPAGAGPAGRAAAPDSAGTGDVRSAPTSAGPADSAVVAPVLDGPPALAVGTVADAPAARTSPSPSTAAPRLPASPAAPTADTASPDTRAAAGALTEPERPTPSAPEPAAPIRPASATMSAGGLHSCILARGDVYCWGSNDAGQLGDGSRIRRSSATRVAGDVRAVAVSAGISHTCALAANGRAYCWGRNDRGQLGDGTVTSRAEPAAVDGAPSFTLIRTGMSHTCALTAGGDAYCWGADQFGQLGDGARTDRRQPVRVRQSEPFADLALGWGHTCGLSRRGVVYCWGQNASGQLGDGTTADRGTPAEVAGNVRFASIAAGSRHTCGATAEGELYCWGQNGFGQLGDGSSADRARPVRAVGVPPVFAIAAGSVHSCALARGGNAYCWGRNVYGQVGDGTTVDRAAPARVQGGHAFASIQANGAHTCGTTPSGENFCWGYNVEGQLGDGSRTHRARPVYVEKPTD